MALWWSVVHLTALLLLGLPCSRPFHLPSFAARTGSISGHTLSHQCYELHEMNYVMRMSGASSWWRGLKKRVAVLSIIPLVSISMGAFPSWADDELAKFAAEGNKVNVDGQCFFKKCALETSACANDASCLKGLSCLARCKGGSMCSTGCFAKYGSERLDNILSCSVEKNDCVQVPGKESTGWTIDKLSDLPAAPLSTFELRDLEGKWYKVMGLDSRYDCFDCQKNTFKKTSDSSMTMEAMFRIPRPNPPGYFQNRIIEELRTSESLGRNDKEKGLESNTKIAASADTVTISDNKVTPGGSRDQVPTSIEDEAANLAHFQSKGEMFGLTFWENWYVLGESKPTLNHHHNTPNSHVNPQNADLRLVYYTGHTLQGSYKGAFLLARQRTLSPQVLPIAAEVIRSAGLNINDFCVIRNACFASEDSAATLNSNQGNVDDNPTIRNSNAATEGKPAFFGYTGRANSNSLNQAAVADSNSPTSLSSEAIQRLSTAVDIDSKDDRRINSVGIQTDDRTSSNSGEGIGDNYRDSDYQDAAKSNTPFWLLGQGFFKVTEQVAAELADWFQDPALLSDWLVSQQERIIFTQPLEASPFASLVDAADEG